MKIWYKILVAPGVAIAFLLLVGATAFLMLKQQNGELDKLVTQRMARFEAAAGAARDMGQLHSSVYRLITWIGNYDEAKVKAQTDQLVKSLTAIGASLARLASGDMAPEERRLLDAVQPLLGKYRAGMEKSIDISTIDVSMGLMVMQATDAQFQSMIKELDALVQLEEKLAGESHQAAEAAYHRTVLMLALLVGVAVAAAVLVAWRTSRSIVRPLSTAIAAANRIADGDLTTEIRAPAGGDESAQLLRAIAAMNQNLRGLVSDVTYGARTVAETSAQIAQGNVDLSQRTEEQAGTLEETASSMEELTSSVTQNAQNARQASELAVGASGVARKGGGVMGEVVATMSGISEASRKISDIIGVIDGIAFQTNILALNAAVEAARAGDQGRGFAVVASEVRQLAQRSAEAAKQIKALIGDSVAKVDAGTRLVGDAGRTMEDIVASVARVSDLIADIAAASQEQSSGIGQVNTAVTQMDQVVQQNATLVEESTAATESMKQQAESLLQLVSRFRVQALDEAAPQPQHAALAAAPRAVGPIRVRAPKPQVSLLRPVAAPEPVPQQATGSWREF